MFFGHGKQQPITAEWVLVQNENVAIQHAMEPAVDISFPLHVPRQRNNAQ